MKDYIFAWDRVLDGHHMEAFGTNLKEFDSSFDKIRFGAYTEQLPCYAKSVGNLKHVTLDHAVKNDLDFFYQIGTWAAPWTWFGGLPGDKRINLFDFIAKNKPIIIKKLQEGKCTLHLDQGWEGTPFITDFADYYQVLYNKLDDFKINPQQIIYTTSNLLEKQIHDRKYSKLKNKIKIASAPVFAELVKKELEDTSFEEQIDFKSNNKIKYFTCFNRTIRRSRTALSLMLNYYGLADSSLADYSFPRCHGNETQTPIQLSELGPQNWTDHPAFSGKNKKRFLKKLPFIVDLADVRHNPAHNINKETFLNTWFSVVPETFIDEYWKTSFFFSEKAFKPIKMVHPFIIAGHPHSIRQLHNLGFKTFGKWWDESYSDIVDHTKRIEAISLLIKDLTDKSQEEWLKIYKDMQEVLVYNKNHLENHKFISYKDII